jgi:hypothetical protein
MASRGDAHRNASDFVQLLREFLEAHEQLTTLLGDINSNGLSFGAIRRLVGDDDRCVLYRLKEKSHALFRSEGYTSAAVRREALFDLAVGSLFHESMKLRERLYQREVYGPRVASLRAAAGDEAQALFLEFDRILARSSGRVEEVRTEVRELLIQTRDQFRLLIVERAGERGVTRTLHNRRKQVDAAFPEQFKGLIEAMHGNFGTGLVEAAHALVESAYFVEATKTLREAALQPGAPKSEITQLRRYAEGMQAFLDADYAGSIAALEDWVDLGAQQHEGEFARRAAAALGRLGRLVENDAEGAALVDAAKQLQLRLEAVSG